MSVPRATHQWLQPLYDMLEGRGRRPLQLGSATGLLGALGATGSTKIPASQLGATGSSTGAAGGTLPSLRSNGGFTGTAYLTFEDVVNILKRHGFAP